MRVATALLLLLAACDARPQTGPEAAERIGAAYAEKTWPNDPSIKEGDPLVVLDEGRNWRVTLIWHRT